MYSQVAILIFIFIALVHADEDYNSKQYEEYSSINKKDTASAGKEIYVDSISPPKYEYKYAVDDSKTKDQKEQSESRIDNLTKSEYSVQEKDRKIKVSRVIAGKIPVKVAEKY